MIGCNSRFWLLLLTMCATVWTRCRDVCCFDDPTWMRKLMWLDFCVTSFEKMVPFYALLLISAASQVFAFRKVIVPSVYKEWINGVPSWAKDQKIMKEHGYSVFVYQKLDPSLPHFFGFNRGTESGVYLKYIVDHYENFPDVAIFVHARPHDHNPHWLDHVACINPNATWYNINFGSSSWVTRYPNTWG